MIQAPSSCGSEKQKCVNAVAVVLCVIKWGSRMRRWVNGEKIPQEDFNHPLGAIKGAFHTNDTGNCTGTRGVISRAFSGVNAAWGVRLGR